MNTLNEYLDYRVAARLAVITFILTYSYFLLPFFMNLGLEDPMIFYRAMYSIQSLLMIYVWLSFRKLLIEKFQFKAIDPFILIVLAAIVVFNLAYLTNFRESLPDMINKASSLGYSGVFILFASKLLTLPDDLYERKTQFAYSLIAAYLISLPFTFFIEFLIENRWLMMLIQLVGFVVGLLNTIFWFQIFIRGAKDTKTTADSPMEGFITEIGDE